MRLLLLLVGCLQLASSAKILGLFGHPGKSHFDVFQPLLQELARRGHQVTVYSFFPLKNKQANYSDVSFEGLMPVLLNALDFNLFEGSKDMSWAMDVAMPFLNVLQLQEFGEEACERVLPSKQIQDLLRTDERYDLVITELFNTECFLGVIEKLKAPYITLSSCSFMPWFNRRFGNPVNSAYMPSVLYGVSDRMSFWERAFNTFVEHFTALWYEIVFVKHSERQVALYVDPNHKPLTETAKNASLMLINTHFTIHRPRPLVPTIVEIGGMHIGPAKPLPKEIELFINQSTNGVLIFSLGSILKAETLDVQKRQAFIEAFKEIPQRVIWKFEKELPGLPDNVRIYPWLPQRDILEHPNVRGFLGHGGLLGLTEAVYTGTPVLGIPMFGDQYTNIRVAAQAGMAVELSFFNITKENVLDGLNKILSPSYYERAQELSRKYRDRPLQPLETAVYWTEYVLKYRGAPHLRTTGADLSFVQYYLIDVVAAITLFTSLLGFLLYRLLKLALGVCQRPVKTKTS